MSSRNIDFSDYHKVAPIGEEPPRERGCFFYGCVIAAVLSVLLMIAVGVISYVVYRWLGRMVDQYTATAPRTLPAATMPADERARLRERVESFRTSLTEGRHTPPLVLTAEDLNALIDENPDWKGKVYLEIVDDKMKGQVSIPLDNIPLLGLTQGRYLNGEAEFNVRLKEGVPMATIIALEVNGKAASEEFMAGIRGRNLLQDMQMSPKAAAEVNKLESIEIKDGALVLTPRAPAATESGPGDIPLPDDVFAPPGSRPAVPIEPVTKPSRDL